MKDLPWICLLLLTCVIFIECQQETTPSTKNICTESFLCDSNYCSKCLAGKCAAIPQEDCSDGKMVRMYENKDDHCDCCEARCVKYRKEGELCDLVTSKATVQGICGPQLTCDASSHCVKMDTACMRVERDYKEALDKGTLGMDQAKPMCDDDGDWASRQCAGNGVCRCVNTKTGEPTFGLATTMEEATRGNMDCGCSAELQVLKEIGCGMQVTYRDDSLAREYKEEYEKCMKSHQSYFPGHLRCMPNGNFDSLQCVPNVVEETGSESYNMENCFCIDYDLKINSTIIPINILDVSDVLYCYIRDPENGHFPGFYRPCEATHAKLKENIEKNKLENKLFFASASLPSCSPDGFFDKLQQDQENKSLGYCVDRMGEKIENYGGLWEDMTREDSGACECALVWRYTGEGGEKPVCEEDGSYRNWQCRAAKCYCVDQYGRQCNQEKDRLDFEADTCDNLLCQLYGDK